MGKKKTSPAQQVLNTAQQRYNEEISRGPSQAEQNMTQLGNQMYGNYNDASARQTQDYGNIMKGYQDFSAGLGKPTKFSFERVNAERPRELGEAYGYLREAMPGYRDFANTGGYSDKDVQELRARGISPIRASYGNTMMQLDRARALGGNGGAPNYIAAVSRAQRELPEQMAEAMTGVNAELANSIRQGKMFGLSGITQTGSTMGGLADSEAGRMLQAALANQGADIQTQGMSEQSLQNMRQMQLASLGGQANLFGTTPGMSNMFGNQALNAYQSGLGAENSRRGYGLDLLNTQLNAASRIPQSQPWWQKALGFAGTAAPYLAQSMGGRGGGNPSGGDPNWQGPVQSSGPSKWKTALGAGLSALPFIFSSETFKEEIEPVENLGSISQALKELPLYTWKYKGDKTRHFGPIAEQFQKKFGVGDGKTIHLADVMGVVLASQKEALADA